MVRISFPVVPFDGTPASVADTALDPPSNVVDAEAAVALSSPLELAAPPSLLVAGVQTSFVPAASSLVTTPLSALASPLGLPVAGVQVSFVTAATSFSAASSSALAAPSGLPVSENFDDFLNSVSQTSNALSYAPGTVTFDETSEGTFVPMWASGTSQSPIILASPIIPLPTTPSHPITIAENPIPLIPTPVQPRQSAKDYGPVSKGPHIRSQSKTPPTESVLLSQNAPQVPLEAPSEELSHRRPSHRVCSPFFRLLQLFFVRCSVLLVAAVFASNLPPVASIDILSVHPSSIYAGTPAQLQLQVDPSAFSIPKIADVSIGGYHTCACSTLGALYCWGRGDYGQIGNGRNDRQNSRPVLVLSSGVVSVSLGYLFTCALTLNASVICFGRNLNGELGDGTVTNRNTPVGVIGLQSNVTAIACGIFHACALNSTGHMLCWGWNNYGQLGDGTTTSRSSSINVPNLPHITAIAVGYGHSCALGLAPTSILYCWGWNFYGQVGKGELITQVVQAPTPVIGLGPVSLFSVGAVTTCASSSSSVYCWGWNAAGQLGDGTFVDRASPAAVLQSGMGTPREMSIGDLHACVVDTANFLWCWGSITHMRIHATTDQSRAFYASLAEPTTNSSAAIVPLPSKPRSLKCRDKNTCIVSLISDTLLCWGSNSYGQVGDGTTLDTELPTSVFESCSSPAVGSIRSGLSCSWNQSSVVITITYISPLSQLAAQRVSFYLGPFAFTSVNASSLVTVLAPQALISLTPSVVFASSSSVVVLTVAGRGFGLQGGIVTLGRIGAFTAGLSFSVVSDTAVTVRVDVGSAVSVASAAALDVEFFVNGSLFRSGDVSSRLMVTSALAVVFPSAVYTATGGKLTFVSDQGFGVQSCSMGRTHSCAVMIGGLLLCWGDSANGRLGSASGATSPLLPVSGFSDPVLLVSAGSQHTCAVTVQRDAFCLGSNQYGQLGDGTLTSSSTPVLVEGGHKWSNLHSSSSTTCGVTIAGAVYCWGRDEWGQAGSGGIVTAVRPSPNSVVTLSSGFLSVSCASWSCCALRYNGELFCWGDADNGELGQGDLSWSGVPLKVSLPGSIGSNFTSISGGGLHFCAISANFQVWCWGLNTNGQCGTPSSVAPSLSSPTLVLNTPTFVSHVAAGSQHSCAANASVLVCWGSNPNGQLGDGSDLTATSRPASIVPLPLFAYETIRSVSSNRGWSVGVVSSFNRLFVWGNNGWYQLGDGSNRDQGSIFSSSILFPQSLLRIGASSDFDSLTWIGQSTFSVQFNSRSFSSPSNGGLSCGFNLGPFAFTSVNASSLVTVLAPQALISLTPSVVFASSSSVVVLTVAGRGFGLQGGIVTLGRIGAFTAGLSFSVVSDTAVTVRVDVGSAVSVASAAALDVEFFVNGSLFRSASPGSRLSVCDQLDRLYPSELFAHNLRGGVFLTVFGNQFGPAGGSVSEGRIGAVTQDLTFSVVLFNASAISASFRSSFNTSSYLRSGSVSSVVLVSISPSSSVVEQLLGRPLTVEFAVNSKRFLSSSSSSVAVVLQVLSVQPTSIFVSRAAVLTLQVDSFGQLRNNMSQCLEVMIGAVALSSPCVWITSNTVRVSVSASDTIVFNSVAQSLQFWDGAKLFKSTVNSSILVLPYQADTAVPSLPEAPSNVLTYLLSFGISLGVLFAVSVAVYLKQRAARQRLKDKLASQNDSSYDGQVCLIDPSKVMFAEHEVSRPGFFGSIRKAVWSAAPGVDVAVAVKQRNSTQCPGWDVVRFEKAVQDWAALRHPNCIRLLGYCTQADNIFVTMEWLQKGSLADVLEAGEAVPPHARLRMARELAQGLAFLHAHGTIHGSIKNRNILMAQDGTVKLGDRVFTEMQRFCSVTGASDAISVAIHDPAYADVNFCAALAAESVAFMAPEVLDKKPNLNYHDIVTGSHVSAKIQESLVETLAADTQQESTHASAPQDVFALGVVMWSLLAWRKPLDGMSERDVKNIILDGYNLPPVIPLPKGITSDYVEVMNLCLSKDPALRPTAQLLSERLTAIDPSTRPVQPIDLIPPGFISDKTTLLDCVLVAMPNERDKLQLMIKKIARFHSTDTDAIRIIRECGLTKLEAQSISFYTFSADNGFEWQDSPFFIYNKAVRMLDFKCIATWQDYSYYFTSALKKLPSIQRDVFRGLDLRLTQMSHLYQEDGLVCWNAVTSTTTDKKSTLQRFGTSSDGDGATFVEIRAIHAKDISPLSMVKSENELALSPNTMFKVVACYTSEHLNNLRGLLNIPEKVDMIVLQEIDNSDSDQVLPDDQSPYIRHVKTIAATAPLPAAAIISQPSHEHLAQTAAHVSVDSSETDSVVSMSELAPSGSDFVDLQERTAPDEVVLTLMAHSGHASAQPTITGEPSASSLSSTSNDVHRALLERDREIEQLRIENQLLRLQLAGPVALDDQDFLDV